MAVRPQLLPVVMLIAKDKTHLMGHFHQQL
ncbi:hypothetical protein AVDCRST_MAG94-4141, partial [uncultured Leptolyngbya sp.]